MLTKSLSRPLSQKILEARKGPSRRPPEAGGKRAGLKTRCMASRPSRGLRFRIEVTSSITEFESCIIYII